MGVSSHCGCSRLPYTSFPKTDVPPIWWKCHHAEPHEAVGSISGESLRIAVKPAHQRAGLIGESTGFVKNGRIEHGFDGHGKRCARGDRPLGLLVELRVILALRGDDLVEIMQCDRESDIKLSQRRIYDSPASAHRHYAKMRRTTL